MEEMLKTLPQHTCSWSKGKITFYKYQDFWTLQELVVGAHLAQQSFKAEPTDIFLCTSTKTGTTWVKSLAFAIVTRQKFDDSTTPLLTKNAHECVPSLEYELDIVDDNRKNSSLPLVATHLPYPSLPKSVIASNCKIVYVYRNTKDVIVSHYHFLRKVFNVANEDAPFEEAFEEFCQGISGYGPYWDHIIGYWKASLERPDRILLLKYEDLKKDPTSNAKKLAEFMGYPFSTEEEKAGVIEKITTLCSFENMSNLEVNKTGSIRVGGLENKHYFRKAEDGDWRTYFTNEMKEKIDKLIDEKLNGTGLILK
ncbi:flavonol sulfotransferase-like [Rutidosis leptorrhynchoides]|uniref:flavonol sulfotransferase-like n=1 Tax=Rutidosis leptorrhynchoides TaxID=125765 RepID=UPI003A99881A